MSEFFIPGVGYRSGAFKDAEGRSYPRNWLALATQGQLDALGAVPQPPYDKTTQKLLRNADDYEVVNKTQNELDAEKEATEKNRVNSFFYDVDQYMESIFPRNERERLAGAIADPRTPAEAIPMIQAMTDWSDGCWDLYYSLKPDVAVGKDASFTPPKAPHTFLEIMAVVRGG
jgi:hypothetical protein